MKKQKAKLTNIQQMDKSLDKVLHQVVDLIAARKANQNAYDDDLADTWANFRTEADKLQKEISLVVSCIQLEDSET